MAKESVLDQLKALDEQRSKLLDSAKAEALEKAREAIEELNELGFHYRLTEGAATRAPRTSGEAPKRTAKDVACPICGFKTNPLHDRRSHRTQQPKKPFTDTELKERHLVKA